MVSKVSSDCRSEGVGTFFLGALISAIVLYELISGELASTRFGGWVYTREKEPGMYWSVVLTEVAALLALVGRLAIHCLIVGG